MPSACSPPASDHNSPPPAASEILADEQDHLRSARAALREMRGRTEKLDPQSTGNWVSAQYLETLLEVRPKEVWITHGREDALMHWCAMRQIKARELNLVGYEDEDD